MPSKLSRLTVGVIIGVLLGGALFSSGWILRAAIAEGGIPIPGLGLPLIQSTPPMELGPGEAPTTDLSSLFTPFWEAWDIVHEDFVHQPVDEV